MRTPRDMPPMTAIVDYWRDHQEPWLKAWYIGWGEPFCFACGWLPPARDGRADSWRIANKWLDRAHLWDKFYGGPDEPFNIVPLCHLCHHDMPESHCTATGLQWVKDHPASDYMWQLWTDTTLRDDPTHLTTVTRSRMRYLEAMRELDVAQTQPTGLVGGAISSSSTRVTVDHLPARPTRHRHQTVLRTLRP